MKLLLIIFILSSAFHIFPLHIEQYSNIIDSIFEYCDAMEVFYVKEIKYMGTKESTNVKHYQDFKNGRTRIDFSSNKMSFSIIMANDSVFVNNVFEKTVYVGEIKNNELLNILVDVNIFEVLNMISLLNGEYEPIEKKNKKNTLYTFNLPESPASRIEIQFNSKGLPEHISAYTDDNKMLLKTVFKTFVNYLPKSITTQTMMQNSKMEESIRINKLIFNESLNDTLFSMSLTGLKVKKFDELFE